MILYFFIQEDYKDPRELKYTSATDRLFLPLISPDPPYDRYNMLSWNHLFDYFNIILFWSTSALLLLGALVTYFRKKINWQHLALLMTGLPLFMYSAFLFVFNPLLSMPMDWDLFSLVFPILMMFIIALITQIEPAKNLAHRMVFYCLAFALLNVPIFYVNATLHPYSERLQSLGVRVFKTYYEWSGMQLDFAASLLSEDKEKEKKARATVLHKLRPHALTGNDEQYAHLTSIYGTLFLLSLIHI